jgi:hypothetical protein
MHEDEEEEEGKSGGASKDGTAGHLITITRVK